MARGGIDVCEPEFRLPRQNIYAAKTPGRAQLSIIRRNPSDSVVVHVTMLLRGVGYREVRRTPTCCCRGSKVPNRGKIRVLGRFTGEGDQCQEGSRGGTLCRSLRLGSIALRASWVVSMSGQHGQGADISR